MQELLNAVRGTGATNLVMVAGVGYAGLMTRWLSYKPIDPLNPPNIAAATHIYPQISWCPDAECWDNELAPVAAQYPLITGEMGQSNCAHDLIDGVIDWMESKQQHYLAWVWWTEPCAASPFYGLITNYLTGSPSSGYGQGYRDRLLSLVQDPAPTPSATPTPSGLSCSPRPPVGVVAVPDGSERLRVTISANGVGNALESINFVVDQRAAGNALIDIAGQTSLTPPYTLGPLPAGTTSLSFYVRPARGDRPVTLPFIVTDHCGPYPTFVGGGADAF
jgi:hypothetical protein